MGWVNFDLMILYRLLSIYGLLVFSLLFLILFPGFLLVMYVKPLSKYSYLLDRIWAFCFFFLLFFKVEIEFEEPLDKNKVYVFAANHFSYLDIAVMGFLGVPYAFVGKASITKVPLFGWMFKKLHIPVNRSSLKSRFEAAEAAKKMVEFGRSVVFFPEGGIVAKQPPRMVSFKDGAFKTAIERQVPIVPISLPYNWIILPDDGSFLLRGKTIKFVVHKPISTANMDASDIKTLKEKVHSIIQNQLDRDNTEKELIKQQNLVTE